MECQSQYRAFARPPSPGNLGNRGHLSGLHLRLHALQARLTGVRRDLWYLSERQRDRSATVTHRSRRLLRCDGPLHLLHATASGTFRVESLNSSKHEGVVHAVPSGASAPPAAGSGPVARRDDKELDRAFLLGPAVRHSPCSYRGTKADLLLQRRRDMARHIGPCRRAPVRRTATLADRTLTIALDTSIFRHRPLPRSWRPHSLPSGRNLIPRRRRFQVFVSGAHHSGNCHRLQPPRSLWTRVRIAFASASRVRPINWGSSSMMRLRRASGRLSPLVSFL